MKKGFVCFVLFIVFFSFSVSVSAAKRQDVVYLKNGSVIRREIERIPGKTIKVETRDGSVFVYKMSEVEKIAKEEVKGKAA
ncbi:MAG TPA: hypothetical protein ENN43_07085 [bacterium]|nr:hypothetical protein [bacterium]